MVQEVIQDIATADPLKRALGTMMALRQSRQLEQKRALELQQEPQKFESAQALAQLTQRINELKLQQAPQAFQTLQALKQAQTEAALATARKVQKPTVYELYNEGIRRLQKDPNDAQGRFMVASGLHGLGLKIGNLGKVANTDIQPTIIHATTAPTETAQNQVQRGNDIEQVAQVTKPQLAQDEQKEATDIQQNGNQSLNIIRNLIAPETDEFQKSQSTALSKELVNTNADATNAMQEEIPLYKNLKSSLADVRGLVNPITGHIVWTSAEGQRLHALLVRAQGNFIKQFHLGRMTQLEFNLLKSAIGQETMYPSTLESLFQDQLDKGTRAVSKAKFFHNYVQGGGRNAEEINNNWLKELGKKGVKINKAADFQQSKIVPTGKENIGQTIGRLFGVSL